MSIAVFDFRVCVNPECGLRYPVQRGNKTTERCPICLGSTIVVAESRTEYESPEASETARPAGHLRALLDNVRSALNVGSIFRSAEGYGVEHLYLCGITPTPETPELGKTALGAEYLVPWSAHKNAVRLIASLKESGHCIWALEQTAQSRALETAAPDAKSSTKRVLVVGNERAGVDPGILELADQVVHLEMRGRKDSFNVAVAFAVAAHVLDHQQNWR